MRGSRIASFVITAVFVVYFIAWAATGIAMATWSAAHDSKRQQKEEGNPMAYNKPGGSDLDEGVPIGDEAASDEARGIMRLVNGVMEHAGEIEKLLKLVPPTASRQIAEQKVKEVVMWAGQAFIDADK